MTTRGAATSRWPTGTEYAAAVQQPSTSFSDEEVCAGNLTLTPLGLPAMASGQSAVAFHMQCADRPVAVRCLLNAHDDGRLRYQALDEHVEAFNVPAVVAATWLDEGIRVHGRWWPIVVMPWVSGTPLHAAIDDRLTDPGRLARLADRWLDLVEILQDKEFAHGDYQHGNVLLTDDDEFQLVDLDGIWVPDMGVGPPNEYGHPNYQHVNRSDTEWGPYMDTFSALVIALSMLALADDPSLARYMTGENLLFCQTDFQSPGATAIWDSLQSSSNAEVVDLAARLVALARLGRCPALSVREVLDASFDPDSLVDDAPFVAPPALPSIAPESAEWWAGDSSFWRADGEVVAAVAAQPEAPGAPGQAAPAIAFGAQRATPAAAFGHTAAPPPAPSAPPTTESPVRRSGLAAITGQPVLAGLISGAVAGLLGSLLAGILQTIAPNDQVDGGLFVGMIAGTLGGAVHSWSALNLENYGLALRRFLIGASVGLVAGIIAVFVADVMTRATLDFDDTENAGLVAYIWALTAALVGLAIGLLRSPKAGAYAFSGGAVAGFVGGFVHGAADARFERRALQVNGFDGGVLIIATFIAMLIGVLIAVAIRTARSGSLVVIEGPGQGTVIDFHSDVVTIGGGSGDTLVIKGQDLPGAAVTLDVGDQHADVSSAIVVHVDGNAQPPTFELRSGQVMAVAGLFVRLDVKSELGGP